MNTKNDLIIKATASNSMRVVKYLFKKTSNSFDIGQIRDKKGNTVLHYAVRNSNHELAQLFINKYKIDVNFKNQHEQTPLTFAIENFVTGVGGEENLSSVERLNRRFSRGNNLMIIDLLLRSGAKLDRAEHNYLLGIIKNQKSNNEYVPLCEKIEETLSSILGKKQEKEYENLDYTGHIHNIPEYSSSSQYGISGYDNIDDYTSEHIYEDIDELRDNKEGNRQKVKGTFKFGAAKEPGNTGDEQPSVTNLPQDVASILARKAEIEFLYGESESDWSDDGDEYPTLSNPQSDDEKRSWTPESGYRSGDDAGQQKSKIAALPSYQSNIWKPLISPKSANLQTKPQAPFAQKRLENKIYNPSFNKAHGPASSFNQSSTNGLTERRKLFENNTPNPNQQQRTTAK